MDTTNEPDHKNANPDTYFPPQTAADIWRFTQDLARRGNACKTCNFIAGEFSTVNLHSFKGSYVDQYMNYLADQKKGKYHPMYWGMHDYGDLIKHDKKGKPLRNYPYAKRFVTAVRDYFGKRRRVELSEEGLELGHGGQAATKTMPYKISTATFINDIKARQDYYAKRYRHLTAVDRQINLVGYYEFFGQPSFDSALVEPAGTTATLPSTTNFRVGYCELANRPLSSCIGGHGDQTP